MTQPPAEDRLLGLIAVARQGGARDHRRGAVTVSEVAAERRLVIRLHVGRVYGIALDSPPGG